jgi:hypothetical protein
MARIVVCGYMLRHPVAGNLLAFFHYVLGLHRLGHQVAYLEESGWPYSCYDPTCQEWQDHPHTGLRIVRALAAEHGMRVPICYVNRDSGQVDGLDWAEVKQMLGAADLLLNVGGVCWLSEFQLCRRRALIDMDPFFTQVAQFGAKVLKDYHVHFTYGGNIGQPGCTVPTCGLDWLPAVPPVVDDLWEGAGPPASAPLTTIANWSSYGGLNHEGEHFGQKDEEFLRLLDLPRCTSQPMELAISGGQEVREHLRRAGWTVRDAGEEVSTDVPTYRAYITRSRGEFSAAKHAYVKTRCGWFSDRSVCYLAAGLPVILQDTGFSDWLPTGQGVLSFSSLDQAVDCIERVNADYPSHRRAARAITAERFDYRVVLPRLLQHALQGG